MQTQPKAPQREKGETQRTATKVRQVRVPDALSVGSLAQLMNASPIDVMKQLMRAGIMANINHVIDFNTAAAIVPAFGFLAAPIEEAPKNSTGAAVETEDLSLLETRPPVVTILGHVDHGKTTLLDSIRKSKVAEKEIGGITQHIGAYQVEYHGQKVTFLDTPGHEAFTAMRSRGAEATDIAVLVVAADDGMMPQTIEALNHAKAAGVPIVVAINKIDRADADVERVKRQLAERDLLIEEWGGEVVAVLVSARDGDGIEDLLENILVVAEIAELKANPNRLAMGVVIEAKLDRSRGPLATVLVKTGTLKLGEHMVVGTTRGKLKALINDAGQRINEALPSMPVEILGLHETPKAGDTFVIVENERLSRALVQEREKESAAGFQVSLEELLSQIRAGQTKDLNLIIKADAQGTIEAIRHALSQLGSDKAHIRIIHAASGTITQTDMTLAIASQAIIIGFNTTLEPGARQMMSAEHIEVRFYNVIYALVEDMQNTMEDLVEPTLREVIEGHATVRAVFSRGRRSKVAGIYVTDGRILRSASARVSREGQIIYDGAISSLKHFKDDVREMGTGQECGIGISGFDDFQEGDVIELHRREQVKE